VRALNDGIFNPEKRTILPGMAFSGFKSRYRAPTIDEGFEDIVAIPFAFNGTVEQERVWGKYWI
jgi:bifunctional polynucleotide phosphatase/kinase